MNTESLNLKENLRVRLKSLKSNQEHFIKLSDDLDAVSIDLILKKLSLYKSTNNKIFLSKCITDGDFKNWKEIDQETKDKFNKWCLDQKNQENFELTFPLHLYRENGGHFGAVKIICKKENGKLKFTAEFYNPTGSVSIDFERAKNIMNNVIKSLVNNEKVYDIDYVDKITKRIQKANTNSCGYYTVEFIKRLSLNLPLEELIEGSLDSNLAKIIQLKDLVRDSWDLDIVENEEEIKSKNNNQNSSDDLSEMEANLLGNSRSILEENKKEKNTKQDFALSEIQAVARKMVIINYLRSNMKKNSLSVEKSGIEEYKFNESELSESLKTFYRTGEVDDNFELKGKVLKYIPKEILDPPTKEGEEKFMVSLIEKDGYLIMKGEYPFERFARIKIPDGKTSVDLIVAIQVNGLNQFKDSLEFGKVDLRTNAGRLEFEKRLDSFNKLREQSRGGI